MKKLDCLGDPCPVPVMKLQKLDRDLLHNESVLLVTDHSCVRESIVAYCKAHRYIATVVEPMNGIWEITITC